MMIGPRSARPYSILKLANKADLGLGGNPGAMGPRRWLLVRPALGASQRSISHKAKIQMWLREGLASELFNRAQDLSLAPRGTAAENPFEILKEQGNLEPVEIC